MSIKTVSSKPKNYKSFLIYLLILIFILTSNGLYATHKAIAAPNSNLAGDLNNDNIVNVFDLSILLVNFGTTNSVADINLDGLVNVFDMSVLLANFGKSFVAPAEVSITAYTTGYGWPDNTPPGDDISSPVIHQQAGGTGTYADPVTLAVGHSIINGKDILDYPSGTMFYIPNVRRYFIVEDTCGDGSTPQNGPCHTGYPADTSAWVDLWVGGQNASTTAVDNCESFVTDSNGDAHTIIENPANNYVVVPGPLFSNGSCTQVYGNAAITQ